MQFLPLFLDSQRRVFLRKVFSNCTHDRLAYAWKLALVAISVLPVLLVTGFLEMRLQDHLQDALRDAYGNSAAIACEQIAAIRTVASLRREAALHAEFVTSLNAPVRKAMLSTAKSTFVV